MHAAVNRFPLRLRLLLPCAALLCSAMPGAAAADPPAEGPHSVVLIIVDGIHYVNELTASRYLSGGDDGLSFQQWEEACPVSTWDITTYNAAARALQAQSYDPAGFDPVLGYDPARGGESPSQFPTGHDDYFIGRPATDSSAAATALATGRKTVNGRLAWAADDQAGALTSITDLMRQRGGAVGLCTTVPFCHATPGAFGAHSPSRSDYPAIAREMLFVTAPDVLIGAGLPRTTGGGWDYKYVSPADMGRLQFAGDTVLVQRRTGVDGGDALLEAAQRARRGGRRLVGLFGGPDGICEPPVPLDRPGRPGFTVEEENPRLWEMAEAALNVLSRDPDGFLLMLEQGDVDLANHANDFAWSIGAMWDAHLAAQHVVDWIDRPGDAVTRENTLVILVPDHTLYIRSGRAMNRGELPLQLPVEENSTDPWEYSWRYPSGEVIYAWRSHTNELGRLHATGAAAAELFGQFEGSWYPGTRIVDNTQVYAAMAQWLGLD